MDSVAAAYYFLMVDSVARNAQLLGKQEDAVKYRGLAERIRRAYIERYWDPTERIFRTPTSNGQSAYLQYQNVLPIVFGIAPESEHATIVRRLNADLVAHDYQLSSTGVFSGRYLPLLLSDFGYGETVYRLVTRISEPSWGYWIENGLQTMLEEWSLRSRSYNHHYWGSISSWFYQGLAGIRPAAPGYATIMVKPVVPEGLEWVRASIETVVGRIDSRWIRRGDNAFELNLTIPPASEADVWCSRPINPPALASVVREDKGYSVYRVGAGTHRFECTARIQSDSPTAR